MFTDTIEPILDENNDPNWLKVKIKKVANANPKKSIQEIIKENNLLVEVLEFEVVPQGLWQCRRCGAKNKILDDTPSYCDTCKRSSTFKSITKTINQNLWKLPKWEDIHIEDLDMLGLYDDTLKLVKESIIFSKEIEYKIFTLWNISTWKSECWDSVGFPIFIGIPNSGKSRALRVIHNLAYRAPKASGVKAAAVPRLCHYYNITLLIDEAHTKLNPRTESGSELLNFVKDSYKRDSIYIVCDNNDQSKLITYKNFGFKAFAGEKTFNPALISRSFVFWMEKANPEISKLSYIEKDFEKIRTQLLNYRLKTNDPEDLGNDFCLKGRTREIYESIISTGKHIGVKVNDIIDYAKKRDKREEEALMDTPEYEILLIIKEFEGDLTLFPDDAPTKIKTETILENLGWSSEDKKEIRRSTQKLGYILKDMGLTTKREKEGRMLFLQDEDNKERLIQLFRRYKL